MGDTVMNNGIYMQESLVQQQNLQEQLQFEDHCRYSPSTDKASSIPDHAIPHVKETFEVRPKDSEPFDYLSRKKEAPMFSRPFLTLKTDEPPAWERPKDFFEPLKQPDPLLGMSFFKEKTAEPLFKVDLGKPPDLLPPIQPRRSDVVDLMSRFDKPPVWEAFEPKPMIIPSEKLFPEVKMTLLEPKKVDLAFEIDPGVIMGTKPARTPLSDDQETLLRRFDKPPVWEISEPRPQFVALDRFVPEVKMPLLEPEKVDLTFETDPGVIMGTKPARTPLSGYQEERLRQFDKPPAWEAFEPKPMTVPSAHLFPEVKMPLLEPKKVDLTFETDPGVIMGTKPARAPLSDYQETLLRQFDRPPAWEVPKPVELDGNLGEPSPVVKMMVAEVARRNQVLDLPDRSCRAKSASIFDEEPPWLRANRVVFEAPIAKKRIDLSQFDREPSWLK